MENKFIAKELFITTTKLRRYLDYLHKKNGIYLSQARALIYLYYNKDKSVYQKDLEKHFQIRKASVSNLIDSLIKIDLVNKLESKKDKRRRKIVLTDLGVEKSKIAIETIKEFENDLSKAITKDEFLILNKSLAKINNWLIEKE